MVQSGESWYRWVDIVDRVDVPYDTDRYGQEMTTPMDVLSCGHQIPSVKKVWRGGSIYDPGARSTGEALPLKDSPQRRCFRCEKMAREQEGQA